MTHSKFAFFSVLAISALLSGCVGVAGMMGASVKAYEGPDRKDSELATLVRTRTEGASGSAFVKAIDDVDYGDDLLRGWPSVVKVLPGNHKISVKCHIQRKYAFPWLRVDVKAGHTYEVGCRDRGNGYAEASISELEADK